MFQKAREHSTHINGILSNINRSRLKGPPPTFQIGIILASHGIMVVMDHNPVEEKRESMGVQ